ncbi:MAG: xanthine dehydrogenase family protein molybdopterin-binding subunit [Ardenticatenaceae bacterium]|nr:xanthine dehydrogenase family protein molybdopterin-binding subunit [Ardenticatenaceae bacterium]
MKKWRISRRGFLIGAGVTGAALVVGIQVGKAPARLALARLLSQGGQPTGSPDDPTAWFEITADNTITLYAPKAEMGQGIHTALAQIAAEELEVDWQQIRVVHAPTGHGVDAASGTGGSNSVSGLYTPLREAAATVREMLKTAAAAQLGLAITDLRAENGTIVTAAGDQSRTYGEIVAQGVDWEVPEEAPALKTSSQFHTIGQAKQRLDFPDKLMGTAVYGYDARLPNMLYGAVARPETFAGKLRSAAAGQALSQPGVVAVVADKDFAGVVAESRAQAYVALNDLELEFDEDESWQQADLEALTTVGEGTGVVIQKEGKVDDVLDSSAVMAEYRTPLAVHAHLEPQAALVDVQPDRVEAWVSTQYPLTVRSQIAEAVGMDEERVTVHTTFLGGGFGRKIGTEAAAEAARLSAAAGRPVHVGWNRTEDIRYGYFRPPTHHLLRGQLGGNGRILALEHQQASGDVAFSSLPEIAAKVMGADFGAWRGALIPYAIANRRTVAWRIKLPIRTGWWRGLGLLANVFANESFMDEMAHAANSDPLEFRLQHLGSDEKGQRFRRVLEAVAEKSGWGRPPTADRALGLAVSEDVNTIVAHVAEVSVTDGQIRVHKMTSVVDPGLAINPDGVQAQTQGSIVMGLSSTLLEEITVKNGRVEAGNFDLYPLLTMKETPDMDVTVLSSGDEPFGMGEPPIGPVAAAVANAVFALTGQRIRRLPLRL